MAIDAYLADNLIESSFGMVLRFYQWNPPAVSLGCNQSTEIIDFDACKDRGWDVVFRPTGGRALLHYGDLSYSVIITAIEDQIKELKSFYNATSIAIGVALENLGYKPEAITQSDVSNELVKREFRKDICMTSRVRGEIMIDGIKLVGAAQRIYKSSILQHGSIGIKEDPGELASVMNLSVDQKTELSEVIAQQSCSLKSVSNLEYTLSEITDALIRSFESGFNVEFVSKGLAPDELKGIAGLRQQFDVMSDRQAETVIQ